MTQDKQDATCMYRSNADQSRKNEEKKDMRRSLNDRKKTKRNLEYVVEVESKEAVL